MPSEQTGKEHLTYAQGVGFGVVVGVVVTLYGPEMFVLAVLTAAVAVLVVAYVVERSLHAAGGM